MRSSKSQPAVTHPRRTRTPPQPFSGGPAELWRVDRVARHLDISPKRVYQLVQEGHLHAVRLGPRQTRIARASLTAFITQLTPERP